MKDESPKRFLIKFYGPVRSFSVSLSFIAQRTEPVSMVGPTEDFFVLPGLIELIKFPIVEYQRKGFRNLKTFIFSLLLKPYPVSLRITQNSCVN